MSVEQERDARLFLTDVFGSEPPGLVAITVAPKWGSPHCVKTPADALWYVVDKPDVYFRIGLVAHKPAKRGEESDTVAIPGVWAEIDINGAPDGRGGTITDAAPTFEVAITVAHSVLQPTVMVRSGYGLHAYWLFEQLWRLENDEQRRQAKQLVQGWQARLRHEAKQLGIAKFDSTHDLARVFRVPGSMNGKAGEPAPVRLFDDGGPRYSIEDIDHHVIHPQPERPTTAQGTGRAPEESWSATPSWPSSRGARASRPATAPPVGGTSTWRAGPARRSRH